jgi:NodT family efflux transporter outer membrane factor (OMF) lipoprotein
MKNVLPVLVCVLAACICSLALTACSLAPKYHTPEMDIPAAYKEAGKWLPANPTYFSARRQSWWRIYKDPTLNDLEEKATLDNQNLHAAYARYQEARAQAAVARAGLFPQLTGIANPQRIGYSGNIANPLKTQVYNDTLIGADLSYEIDAWGRIRNQVAAAVSLEQASAADLAAVNLSVHAELATDYFGLRGDEQAQRILDETVKVYKKALYLTRMLHEGGAAPEADVDQAETQLKSTETLAYDIRLKRAQLEHAIAILVGQAPATFKIAPAHYEIPRVTVVPDLPSTLLQSRPDIAAATRRVQAANANIGVARAAFFPDFSLVGTIGFESQILSNLLQMPSLFWAIGPYATQIIFDGGRINAFLALAKADYFETVANYRETVLVAFREVEDNLVAIRRLDQEMITEAAAVKAANRAVVQADYRYRGGIITYLDVVVTQNTALQTELSDVDIRTRRQQASVQLIKAIGGGWQICSDCRVTNKDSPHG